MGKKEFIEEDVLGGSFKVRKLTWAGRVIFFFDVFLALMIITGAGFLFKTEFGRVALIFGFIMLALTVLLKVARKW